MKRKLALYVHIPFCTGRCKYCHYFVKVNPSSLFVERYIDMLIRENKLVFSKLPLSDIKITSVHFGGGTPTFLNKKAVNALFDGLDNLPISDDAEISVEASPETVDKKTLAAFYERGANRISIGAQTFNDRLLSFIGRRHDSKAIENAISTARSVGFDNVNIDLMIGLPHQTLETWQRTIEKTLQIRPDSVTVYFMRLKPEAEFYNLLFKRPELFPSQEELVAMKLFAMERFYEEGYSQEIIGWYSLPNKEYRHNSDKWSYRVELIGLGPSTYSFINSWEYFNYNDFYKYYSKIKEGKLPIESAYMLEGEEAMRRFVIFSLRTKNGIDIARFKKIFGKPIAEVFGKEISYLKKKRLVNVNSRRITLTKKGILFADEIISALFFSKHIKEKLSRKGVKINGGW